MLVAAKELAAKERKTAGKILSEFFRRPLQSGASNTKASRPYTLKNGITVLPSRGEVMTPKQIQRLMEEEGI